MEKHPLRNENLIEGIFGKKASNLAKPPKTKKEKKRFVNKEINQPHRFASQGKRKPRMGSKFMHLLSPLKSRAIWRINNLL